MVGIIFAGQYPVSDFPGNAVTACGHDIGNAYALAAFLPAAFKLMGSYCATP